MFHAANARGHTTLEASRQLGALAVFDTWEGATAEARKHTNAAIRQDLDAHGNEALAVARAAGKAADGIEQVQSELRALRRDAAELQMTIDALSNKVRPCATFNGPPTAALIAEMQLQPRLDAIMNEANAIDAELATAINMADGDAPIPPGPHDNRPSIQVSLSEPLPEDPNTFNELWNRLTPEEKDWLYSQDHTIGNHAGMPWEPTDHLGKDHYNRLHLRELEQHAEADVDRMQHSLDEMTAGRNVDDGALYALQSQLAAARRNLAGYQAVQADLDRTDGVSRFLGFLDNSGHGAVAIGNPDYAKRIGIFVPGTGQDLARLPFSDARAVSMYNAARAADKTLGAKDVSITTWMGYDRPMDLSQAAFLIPPARVPAVWTRSKAGCALHTSDHRRSTPSSATATARPWLARPLPADITSTPTTSSRSAAPACWWTTSAGSASIPAPTYMRCAQLTTSSASAARSANGRWDPIRRRRTSVPAGWRPTPDPPAR